jgi:hypothetical protein
MSFKSVFIINHTKNNIFLYDVFANSQKRTIFAPQLKNCLRVNRYRQLNTYLRK